MATQRSEADELRSKAQHLSSEVDDRSISRLRGHCELHHLLIGLQCPSTHRLVPNSHPLRSGLATVG